MSDYSKEELIQILAARIRDLRKERNMSQKTLAANANKDEQSIQKLEYAKFNPSFFYLFEIAEGLGIHIKELFDIDFHEQLERLRERRKYSTPKEIAPEKKNIQKTKKR